MMPLSKSLLAAAGLLGLGAMHASAQTRSYAGTNGGSFGGPISGTAAVPSMLTFTASNGTLTGTLTIGGNHAFNDEFVIYIDAKAGGFTSTSTLTDRGTIGTNSSGQPQGDLLREATSGYGATGNRATVNFAAGFGADYSIALSPSKAMFGSFYTLSSASNFTYGSDGTNGSVNLTPLNNNGTVNGVQTNMYTFTLPLTLLGSPSSFTFQTTYLNGNDPYRSNEAIGNTITDATTPSNTGSLALDTGTLVGINTFSVVPEPGTWAVVCLAGGLLVGHAGLARFRRQRAA